MLTPGSRLGHYEVIASLGAGGMGEVYRARDTKLNREIALKVLLAEFAADADRLARLRREAQVLAALNHPNIATIHGFEDAESVHALVLELVEGPTLADRLEQGPMPIEEALIIARQIADALEAAHEQNIIHRDLKPANIKLRPDGRVKVLDFGLSKLIESESSSSETRRSANVSRSPTITSPAMTQLGVILGTAAYMAPEQAKGKAIDKRADIWAFGCVLYEMLSGRRPFAGDDVSDTLAFVLTKEVDWSALPADTPREIRALLGRALHKDPKQRLRDIGDARLHLQDATIPETTAKPAASSRWAIAGWVVAAIAIVVAAGLAFQTQRRPAPAAPITRFVITQPSDGPTLENPVIAANGRFLIYLGDRLYVRNFVDFDARPLPGTERASMAFISPDSQWVGFFAGGKLRKVAIAGGDPLVIADVDEDSPGAAWGPGNRIFFTPRWADGSLMSVSADGGPITAISTIDRDHRERSHWWPRPLPDGKHVLFTIWYAGSGLVQSKIGVLDLETGKHQTLIPGSFPRYALGHLVFYHSGTYRIVGFDLATQTIVGTLRQILPDALGLSPSGNNAKPLDVSESGAFAYRSGELNPEMMVSWVARNGGRQPTSLKIRHAGAKLSPDGTKLAIARAENGTARMFVHDLLRHTEQRFDSDGYDFNPVWQPDGQRVGFVSMRKGDFDVYAQAADGGASEPMLTGERDEELVGWLPDGRGIVFQEWQSEGASMIFMREPAASKPTMLVPPDYARNSAFLSGDGRWLALCTNPSGTWQLYVRSVSETGRLQPLTPCDAGHWGDIRWAAGAPRLAFIRNDDLVAVTYSVHEGRFTIDKEEVVAQVAAHADLYGVSPDGQRFLIGERAGNTPRGIRVVLNGFDTLTRAATAQ